MKDIKQEIIEEIHKFNPYHDAKGRFAPRSGNVSGLGTESHGKSGKKSLSGKLRLEAYAKKRGWTPEQGDINEWHKKQQDKNDLLGKVKNAKTHDELMALEQQIKGEHGKIKSEAYRKAYDEAFARISKEPKNPGVLGRARQENEQNLRAMGEAKQAENAAASKHYNEKYKHVQDAIDARRGELNNQDEARWRAEMQAELASKKKTKAPKTGEFASGGGGTRSKSREALDIIHNAVKALHSFYGPVGITKPQYDDSFNKMVENIAGNRVYDTGFRMIAANESIPNHVTGKTLKGTELNAIIQESILQHSKDKANKEHIAEREKAGLVTENKVKKAKNIDDINALDQNLTNEHESVKKKAYDEMFATAKAKGLNKATVEDAARIQSSNELSRYMQRTSELRKMIDTKRKKLAKSMKKSDLPKTFMDACMYHAVKEKGTKKEQAVAICMSMERKWGKSAEGWKRYKEMKKAEDDRRARQSAATGLIGARDEEVDGTFITLQSP